MEKLLLKRQIVDAGIRKQESLINNFRQRIADVMANDGNVNEEEYDSHSQSFKSEGISEVNLLNNELRFSVEELRELKRIECTDEHHPSAVQFSAVVETDRRTFFVAVSLEEFRAGHQTIFGVSVYSPIYKAMKGKKIGSSFSYGGITYQIEDIF
jgi:hypothetical protein